MLSFVSPAARGVFLHSALPRLSRHAAGTRRHVPRRHRRQPYVSAAAGESAPPPACTRLADLRTHLAALGADAFIVPSADAHNSEYSAPCFARREFISRFTGSAGTVVITANRALLWTDGRYFLQAEAELGAEWELMRAGEKETPSIDRFLADTLPSGSRVAFDPTLHPVARVRALADALEPAGLALLPLDGPNPVDIVWGAARPPLPSSPARVHSLQHAGLSVREKLTNLRSEMKKRNAQVLLAATLDEVAWMFNVRGGDVPHCPVVLAYALVTPDEAVLFTDKTKFGSEVLAHLAGEGVRVAAYDEVVPDLRAHSSSGARVWLDPASASSALADAAGESALVETTPVPLLKAVKNASELAGMRAAHIRDGAALSMFLCWLERRVRADGPISELAAAERLEAFRAAQSGFITPSFGTIAGSGPNGAIIHYSASPDTCGHVSSDAMFLLDSGGQYADGTTDVTRTVHLGTPTAHEKACFTRVLQGHIALDTAVFPAGTPGLLLDTLARRPLWGMGLDYRHGTGHGVGACLNVHEGPHSISSRLGSFKQGLQAGMIVSNEPGYYEAGRFGIRIENLVAVVEQDTPHEFGGNKYLGFERLTFAPIDKALIATELLSGDEMAWVDEYHAQVWEKIGALVDDEYRGWLREATLPLGDAGVGAAVGKADTIASSV